MYNLFVFIVCGKFISRQQSPATLSGTILYLAPLYNNSLQAKITELILIWFLWYRTRMSVSSIEQKNNGFQIELSLITERQDSPIISRQRASFVLSNLGYAFLIALQRAFFTNNNYCSESPTKEKVQMSVPIEVKREWIRPGYTLDRAIYDKIVMATFREFLISIQARESLAFWLETGMCAQESSYYNMLIKSSTN